MVVNLSKGGNIDLSKHDADLVEALVGLGWDARTTDGSPFDLDASAIICGADGKALSEESFVYYNSLVDPSGAVVHQGDNRTGAGDGDDEQIIINLDKVPAEASKIAIICSIDDPGNAGLTFGQVSNAYIRLINNQNPFGEEVRYDLGEDAGQEKSLIFAEIYRYNGSWKMKAVSQGYNSGLAGVIADFGLQAG